MKLFLQAAKLLIVVPAVGFVEVSAGYNQVRPQPALVAGDSCRYAPHISVGALCAWETPLIL